MRIFLVICALTLILLSCDSVDRPEEIENGVDIDAARQSMPLPRKQLGAGPFLEITVPACSGLQPALVFPISTFEWQTIVGVEDPDSVRWIMVNTNQFNDDWNEALNFVRDNPDTPQWHPWTVYDPAGDIGTGWMTPPTEYGSFVFAIHGWEADSTASQDFDWERNAVRVRVANRSTGPLVRLTSDFMAPVVSAHTNTPITVVELSGGTPVPFCWTWDASAYCGVVEAYRYGWDIVDLDDESQWESGFTPLDGSEKCSATRTFLFGTHTFHLEVVDNSGLATRIPIKINVSPAHINLPLDIRPASCTNPLNPRSNGVLGVSLLGAEGFDVWDVDMSTLALYDADMAVQGVKPGRSSIKDVTTAPDGGVDCECPGNDADGFDDLHLKFSMEDIAGLVEGAAMGDVVQLALVGLLNNGTPFMAVDCARIVGFQFEDEEPPETGDLDTGIFQVMNTYFVNGQVFEEYIDISDAVPDTVPHGSWIRILYRATPDAMSYCPDPFYDCIGFQKNFTWSSSLFPGVGETTSWQPVPPEDNDPFTTMDSTSLNVGPVEYTVRFRSADKFGVVDLTPAQIPIVGNFPPALDDFGIQRHDGTLARDGDSVVWDWWNPANFHGGIADTLDLSDAPNIWVVREFFFLVKGFGSDHPKEDSKGGVRSWFYGFSRSDDPAFNQPFGRAGYWADGITVNTVCDTVKLTVRYSYAGDPGGRLAWEALPDWVNRWYDFNIRGRDTGSADTFDQFMFVSGVKTRINTYSTAALGRETEKGAMSFYLSIVR